MKIKVYTSEGCKNCEVLKKTLELEGISYEEVEVDNDIRADLIVNYNIHSTPAIEIDRLGFRFAGERKNGL